MHETERLAAFFATLGRDGLPAVAVSAARTALRRVVEAASADPASRAVAALGERVAGAGSATVLATGALITAPWAAFANAVAAAGRPGRTADVAIVAAALACAQQAGADDDELLVAVVAGRECAARMAAACDESIAQFDRIAVYGATAATVAAGCALGLDRAQLVNALGVVGSMSGGVTEHRRYDRPFALERIQSYGWPAQSAVTAALLAQRGFTGPRSVLEGENGVCRSFSTAGDPRIEELIMGLDSRTFVSAGAGELS
ncbi:MmgE/PrpD family protein [Acrocarpospora catenulata]|uniref:MmgE/PrpD family protein n=1 Tax=Acrocarpospora catenulata TaxID=2836182 RepID=UPI001BD97D6B|nr:MmgE/PrpD family protein [Acrocarpospora catenulata]